MGEPLGQEGQAQHVSLEAESEQAHICTANAFAAP